MVSEIHPCLFCQSEQSTEAFPTKTQDGDTYTTRTCSSCQCVYLNPYPSNEQLNKAYASEYYGEGKKKFVGPIDSVLQFFREARARRVSKRISPGAKTLDIGCGHGQFAESMARRGFDAHGSERSEESAKPAQAIDGVTVHVGALNAEGLGPESFDLVTLFHVFEHLDKPRQTLELSRDILKPGGYLVLSLPNIASWQARLFKGQWLHLDPPRHLFLIPPKALIHEAESFGLKWQETSYLSFEQNVFGYLQSLLNLFFHRDVFFDALKGQRQKITAYSSWPSIIFQALLLSILAPFFVLLTCVEALFQAGGTMELVFQRPLSSEGTASSGSSASD
ncbi:MAG: class I SAM-dependent methyltransferase [Planctomycetota bacterium]|nr:class I SAM-dependent methyltransferase [Planctomycetota bacterium]